MGRSADEVFDIFRRIVNALKGRGAISDFASANGGSLNGGSQSSIGSNFSSQVSNGSADGTFTAIEELINDHIKHMRGRRRRERGGAEYINRLGELLSIVQTEKMKITARDSERDAAIVEVYHNMRDLFGKIAVTKPSPMSDDTLLSFMYSGFCNQLMDLQQSFLACMGTTNYSPEPEPEPEYEPEPRPLPPPPPPPRLEPTPTTWTEPVLTPPPPPKPRLAPEPKPNPKQEEPCFACPIYRYDNSRRRSCTGKEYTHPRLFLWHIYDRHYKSPMRFAAGETDYADDRSEESSIVCNEQARGVPSKGAPSTIISKEQIDALRKFQRRAVTYRNLSEVEYWNGIWDTLFPGSPRPAHPYLTKEELARSYSPTEGVVSKRHRC